MERENQTVVRKGACKMCSGNQFCENAKLIKKETSGQTKFIWVIRSDKKRGQVWTTLPKLLLLAESERLYRMQKKVKLWCYIKVTLGTRGKSCQH